MPARIAIGDGEGLVQAAVGGLGITQVPTWLVNQPLASGQLVQVLPDLRSEGVAMHLVWLKKREMLPKVKVLLEVLTRSLSGDGHRLEAFD